MTMKSDLLKLLKRRWVTPITALEQVRCFSLSQRCGELRREGHNVMDLWVDLPGGKRVKAFHVID